uniref:Uncharacterized protein n=1 Tax=Ananas comosus var. bracteatus TaxID=296719 RepID=A0A6V7PKG8_ANACO|nr:unnamed protein product [Ananas comosus var. bracteatus]
MVESTGRGAEELGFDADDAPRSHSRSLAELDFGPWEVFGRFGRLFRSRGSSVLPGISDRACLSSTEIRCILGWVAPTSATPESGFVLSRWCRSCQLDLLSTDQLVWIEPDSRNGAGTGVFTVPGTGMLTVPIGLGQS